MKIHKLCLMATLLASACANAAPVPGLDFEKWARYELKNEGITDAQIVETQYPFNFTYCRKGSATLWRFTRMSQEQLAALSKGQTVNAVPADQRSVAIESDSASCKVAS